MACSIDTDASQSEAGSDAHLLSWISKYNLQLDTDIYNSLPAVQHKGQLTETVVFIHAVFGTFTYKRKDRQGQTWGHGNEILNELLTTLYQSSSKETTSSSSTAATNATSLIDIVDHVFITCLGTPEDVSTGVKDIMASPIWGSGENSNDNNSNKGKLKVLLTGYDKHLWEFPSIALLQHYANIIKPNSKILYLHTKGVRRNGPSDVNIADWRQYMTYWTVETAIDICMKALDGGTSTSSHHKTTNNHDSSLVVLSKDHINMEEFKYKYETCGNLKRGGAKPIYGGNFWWTSAKWISNRKPAISELIWVSSGTYQSRFLAEEYLLYGSTSHEQEFSHYCVHHTHHDMSFCRTPREMYSLSNGKNNHLTSQTSQSSYYIRKNGNCFHSDYLPKNRTKDSSTWCHHKKLPWNSNDFASNQQ